VDFELSEEQRLIVETVRSFAETELYPHEDLVEELDDVPEEIAQAITKKAIDAGLYAPNMPEELGGGGLGAMELALVERELGRAGYALQMLVHRPSNILQGCAGEQIERYLLPTIRGDRVDCLAMTEPGAGSDVRGMTTSAVRDGDDWIINGRKHFISHADRSDFVILFARTGTEETKKGPKALISAFLVDMGTPGFECNRGSSCVSHRGYHQNELVFDNVRLPATALLGEQGRGFELMDEWLGATRLTVAATSVGRAQRVLEETTRWAADRKQFGQPIGQFQGVGFQIADCAVAIEASNLLTLQAAQRIDRGTSTAQDIAMAKLFASETLAKVTDTAVQVFGGMGLMSEGKIERWWRDARVERIWDGTSEIQRHIIIRSMLRPLGA
jgi:acyl-CoA dehydrogenase